MLLSELRVAAELRLPLRACCFAENEGRKSIAGFWTFSDTTATVSDGEGTKLGEISAAVGGHWLVQYGDDRYVITREDIWAAVVAALQENTRCQDRCGEMEDAENTRPRG